MPSKKARGDEQCTYVAGHFNGRAEALKWYMMWHCPMQHVQGYSRSHWMLSLGDYSLRIAPAAPPGWQQTKQRWSMYTPWWQFQWRYAAVLYHTWRRFMAFRKATTTKRRHRASTRSDITQSDTQMPVVLDMSSWKRAPADMLAPNNNRGMTYQTDEKHLTIFPEYFVGVVNSLTAKGGHDRPLFDKLLW